jgi:hypothetical protein
VALWEIWSRAATAGAITLLMSCEASEGAELRSGSTYEPAGTDDETSEAAESTLLAVVEFTSPRSTQPPTNARVAAPESSLPATTMSLTTLPPTTPSPPPTSPSVPPTVPPPPPTIAVQPLVSPLPAVDPLDPRFDTCKDAQANGYGSYRQGEDPEYAWYHDRDDDGVVCE